VPTWSVSAAASGSAAAPFHAVSPPTVAAAVTTATALPSLNRALVLRMGISIRLWG
jgi:hypothetical protein